MYQSRPLSDHEFWIISVIVFFKISYFFSCFVSFFICVCLYVFIHPQSESEEVCSVLSVIESINRTLFMVA